jgi:basic amino acid/polyamine antiporter, APA family
MARDGMIPELFHKVNPRTKTPVPNTIIVAAVIALLAGLIPINFLAEMTSVGTLVAFGIVSIAVIVLRRREPELPRTFKVPGYPVTPILSVLGCLWIIVGLDAITLLVFLVWTAIVIAWYFVYGRKHSHLGRHEHVGLLKDKQVA